MVCRQRRIARLAWSGFAIVGAYPGEAGTRSGHCRRRDEFFELFYGLDECIGVACVDMCGLEPAARLCQSADAAAIDDRYCILYRIGGHYLSFAAAWIVASGRNGITG